MCTKNKLQILSQANIYGDDVPTGIRDWTGLLFSFPGLTKYDGQDERYKRELAQRLLLAKFLLETLKLNADIYLEDRP